MKKYFVTMTDQNGHFMRLNTGKLEKRFRSYGKRVCITNEGTGNSYVFETDLSKVGLQNQLRDFCEDAAEIIVREQC